MSVKALSCPDSVSTHFQKLFHTMTLDTLFIIQSLIKHFLCLQSEGGSGELTHLPSVTNLTNEKPKSINRNDTDTI